jgi:phosphatidyl-myo-inositol dimannoside synthase
VRLLYVSHSLPPIGRPLANVGGMQRVAAELHDALRGCTDVQLQTLLLRASWRWTHVRILPFAGRLLRRLPEVVRRERIDAVLFSSMVTAALALPVARRVRERGVVTAAIPVGRDVTLPLAPYQRLVPRIFRTLDLVFPISRATAHECETRGARPDQIRIVPCGVEPARFHAAHSHGEARRRLERVAADAGSPLPPDAVLLLAVGRHDERKGFRWFVEQVIPRLPAHVQFWLAGEGPETPAIRAAVERRGLQGRVRLLGRVGEDELATLYRGTDLFVMPNVPVRGDIEGFGVVMLEAGINGLPIVASAREGILDVVEEGENGRLVASGDAEAFVRVIADLAVDRGAREELSARAARYTRDSFTWPAIVARYLDHLREAVAARHPVGAYTSPAHRLETR